MEVRAYVGQDVELDRGLTFATVELGSSRNTPDERELLALVRERLEARGLVYRAEDPDLLVRLFGTTGSAKEAGRRASAERSPATGVESDELGANPASGAGPPVAVGGSMHVENRRSWDQEQRPSMVRDWSPVGSGGYSREEVTAEIRVMLSWSGDRGGLEGALWSGEVKSTGFVRELARVAPFMLDELLGEFPRGSGKPPARTLKIPRREFKRAKN